MKIFNLAGGAGEFEGEGADAGGNVDGVVLRRAAGADLGNGAAAFGKADDGIGRASERDGVFTDIDGAVGPERSDEIAG